MKKISGNVCSDCSLALFKCFDKCTSLMDLSVIHVVYIKTSAVEENI